jgi:hypothetical protein
LNLNPPELSCIAAITGMSHGAQPVVILDDNYYRKVGLLQQFAFLKQQQQKPNRLLTVMTWWSFLCIPVPPGTLAAEFRADTHRGASPAPRRSGGKAAPAERCWSFQNL